MFPMKALLSGSSKIWKTMTLPRLRIIGEKDEACVWDGCDGVMEYWDEQIFDHVFPAMGCSKCPGFWIWGEDAGEWLCSMSYVEWKRRVYR